MKIMNSKINVTTLICALGLAWTCSAYPGTNSGGGGNSAAALDGQRRLLDLLEKDKNDELDYFDFEMKKYDRNLGADFSSSCLSSVMGSDYLNFDFCNILDIASGNDMTQKEMNDKHMYPKALRWAFVDFDLSDVGDTGVIHIDNPASKKQLAIQKDGLVLVNRKEFDSLDSESKAGLKIHESALYAVIFLNPELIQAKGTESVRVFTRKLIKFTKNKMASSLDQLKEAYGELGVSEKLMSLEVENAGMIKTNAKLIVAKDLPIIGGRGNLCVSSYNNCKENDLTLGSSCTFINSASEENSKIGAGTSFVVTRAYKKRPNNDGREVLIVEMKSESSSIKEMSCIKTSFVGRNLFEIQSVASFGDIKSALHNYFSIQIENESRY